MNLTWMDLTPVETSGPHCGATSGRRVQLLYAP